MFSTYNAIDVLSPCQPECDILKTMSTDNNYPNFKPVGIEDKPVFDKFLTLPTYSDFNLLSMLSWNLNGTSAYSLLDGNLIIKIKDYLKDGFVYSILGTTDINKNVKLLAGKFGRLGMVPEMVTKELAGDQEFVISEDRDNFDYILSTEKMTKLDGGNYKPLRRWVRAFEKENPVSTVEVIDLTNSKVQDEIIALNKAWVKKREYDEEKLKEEEKNIKAFIRFANYFNCVSLGLFVREKLVAFTLNELVTADTAMGHYGKADNNFSQASYYLEHKTSEYLLGKGIKYMNLEQDAGLLGLRTAKMTYRPVEFLKKYTVELKA
jgi:uncharacterized protein